MPASQPASAPSSRKQQAIAAAFAPGLPLTQTQVFFDRDGTIASRIQARFLGNSVQWAPGARRSSPVSVSPGIYLCIWRVTGSPGDTYRLRSAIPPQVSGGIKLRTLVGTSNEGTFEVTVT